MTHELVSRRHLLGAFGGLALLNHAVARENNPAAQVADSASSIRITAMKTHRVQHKVYVELSTSAKITGWGEVSALGPTAAEELTKSLFELLDGENPTRIEHLWQKLCRAHRDIRGGPFMCHTLAGLRDKFGTKAIYVAPVGQAVLALREKVASGEVPGIKQQTELFTDTLGHATPTIQVLVAYCHFAVTYRRSPVGLPIPTALARATTPANPALVKLLQELAWQAATQHPLSGVKAD